MKNVTIQRWGASAAIRLPAPVLKQLRLRVGDSLKLTATADAIILKSVKTRPRYQLADLLAQCDLSASEPAEMTAWNREAPAGREA